MGKRFVASGTLSGFQYQNRNTTNQGKSLNDADKNRSKVDEDLIIEENTVYEIDRECYERLKRQRKRKNQDRKNI